MQPNNLTWSHRKMYVCMYVYVYLHFMNWSVEETKYFLKIAKKKKKKVLLTCMSDLFFSYVIKAKRYYGGFLWFWTSVCIWLKRWHILSVTTTLNVTFNLHKNFHLYMMNQNAKFHELTAFSADHL